MTSKSKSGRARDRRRLTPVQRKALGQNIELARKSQTDWSQQELASRIQIDPATMNKIERGKSAPDLATLVAIAEPLGMLEWSLSALFTDPTQRAASGERISDAEPKIQRPEVSPPPESYRAVLDGMRLQLADYKEQLADYKELVAEYRLLARSKSPGPHRDDTAGDERRAR